LLLIYDLCIALSYKCFYDQPQMMNHIVESFPLSKLTDNGHLQLNSAGDNAVTWLTSLQLKHSQNELNFWLV